VSTSNETPLATDTAKPAVTEAPRKINENRLPVPDSIAITVLILFAAMVIAGWFNPMLPWVK